MLNADHSAERWKAFRTVWATVGIAAAGFRFENLKAAVPPAMRRRRSDRNA